MSDYRPKHMVDKEAALAAMQAHSAQIAAQLDMKAGRWQGNEGEMWALFRCLGESRELNEILYDLGNREDEDYKPRHLKRPCSHAMARPAVGDERGGWVRMVCAQCGHPDPHKGDLL